MKTCYLAAPYSHWNPLVRWWRWRQVNRAAAALFRAGYNVFSPISHSHHIAKHVGNGNDSGYWCDRDEAWQRHCLVFALLKLPGYRDSKGVRRELRLAIKRRQEIIFVDPDTYDMRVFKPRVRR